MALSGSSEQGHLSLNSSTSWADTVTRTVPFLFQTFMLALLCKKAGWPFNDHGNPHSHRSGPASVYGYFVSSLFSSGSGSDQGADATWNQALEPCRAPGLFATQALGLQCQVA